MDSYEQPAKQQHSPVPALIMAVCPLNWHRTYSPQLWQSAGLDSSRQQAVQPPRLQLVVAPIALLLPRHSVSTGCCTAHQMLTGVVISVELQPQQM